MPAEPRCCYYGCWGRAGHFLWAPGGYRMTDDRREHYTANGVNRHIDGTLAPQLTLAGEITCDSKEKRLPYGTKECPEGQYLIHHLDSGFTAMQWWDRHQGDTRGASNSTVLLEGKHDAERMLQALRDHFPTVLANLERAGIELVPPPESVSV